MKSPPESASGPPPQAESTQVVHIIHVAGKHFSALSRALLQLPLADLRAQVWFHGPGAPDQGWPLDWTARHPETGLRVGLWRVGTTTDAAEPSPLVRLEVERCREDPSAGGRLLREVCLLMEDERRLECEGAEHFLGKPKDFAWTSQGFPIAFVSEIHQFLERELEGWRRVKTTRSRHAPQRLRMRRTVGGVERSFDSSARYFLRDGDRWLVVDVSCPTNIIFRVEIASSGTEEDFDESFLARLEAHLRSGVAFRATQITASGEPLVLGGAPSWSELFLDPRVVELIRTETEGFFEQRALYEQMKLPYRRGVLLHGPPGSGKTLTGKILATRLEAPGFIWVTPSQAGDAGSIAGLFTLARYAEQLVMFFEDLDLFASHRARRAGSSVLGELLGQLDGMVSNDGLLVIATTNDLDAIEPALKDRPSRFDRVIGLGPAPEAVRRAHLEHLLRDFDIDPRLLDAVAPRTEGFTGAQLQELAVRARTLAAAAGRTGCIQEDFSAARDIAAQFRARPRIGFEQVD